MTALTDRLATLLDEMRAVLEEERRTLVSGNPAAINTVTERKLALSDEIEREVNVPGIAEPDVETLTRLARYNHENAVICDAMLRHLTGALDRLRRIDLHRSYNPDGSEARPSARHALGAA